MAFECETDAIFANSFTKEYDLFAFLSHNSAISAYNSRYTPRVQVHDLISSVQNVGNDAPSVPHSNHRFNGFSPRGKGGRRQRRIKADNVLLASSGNWEGKAKRSVEKERERVRWDMGGIRVGQTAHAC